MSLFVAMLSKLFPLYFTMGAGVGLVRFFGNMSKQLAYIQIYFIAPLIVFCNTMKLDFTPHLLMLPVLFGGLCLSVSAITNYLARKAGTPYAPLLAQASGAMNTGYLGIPIAVILFPEQLIPAYIFTMAGGTVYEATFGYYWMLRGNYSPRDAVRNLLKMPMIYAVVGGMIANALGLTLPEIWTGVLRDFMGAYVVLGALIIGAGLAQNEKLRMKASVLGTMLGIKFLVWPALTWGVLALLRLTPLALPPEYEPILLLMSTLPLAANTAALAAMLRVYPDEAATAVAVSTVLSLLVVPFYALLMGFGHG